MLLPRNMTEDVGLVLLLCLEPAWQPGMCQLSVAGLSATCLDIFKAIMLITVI